MGGGVYTAFIDAVCSPTGLLRQGGLRRVSIASHVNAADSKKHLGTNRSLYHSCRRKGSLVVGGGGLGKGKKKKKTHINQHQPVGGSIDAGLRLPQVERLVQRVQ